MPSLVDSFHYSAYEPIAQTSTSVLWIRNCRAYNEQMTPHALGGLASNQRTLLHMLHMEQQAAGGRQGRHLESMTSYKIIIRLH